MPVKKAAVAVGSKSKTPSVMKSSNKSVAAGGGRGKVSVKKPANSGETGAPKKGKTSGKLATSSSSSSSQPVPSDRGLEHWEKCEASCAAEAVGKDDTHRPSVIPEKLEPVFGSVIIRYNHYKESFPIVDGVLEAKLVDEAYALSFVFKGRCKVHLAHFEDEEMAALPESTPDGVFGKDEEDGRTLAGQWMTLEDGKAYRLVLEEDPLMAEEDAAAGNKPFKIEQSNVQEKSGVSRITAELRAMSTEEIQSGSERYKALLEQRDLEDCLYG